MKPHSLHDKERHEWQTFAASVKSHFREISEEAQRMKQVKNASRATILRNHLNHININILD